MTDIWPPSAVSSTNSKSRNCGILVRVTLGEKQFEADVRKIGDSSFSVLIGNRSFDLEVVPEGDELIVVSRGATTRVTLVDKVAALTASRKRPSGDRGEGRA